MKIIGQDGLWAKGIRLSRTQLWRLEKEKPPKFPKRKHLSPRCVGWDDAETDEYVRDPEGWRERAARAWREQAEAA